MFKDIIVYSFILGLITFLMFFFVKGIRAEDVKGLRAEDNKTQKYYDNRKFDGNYPAKQIRELWMVCSQTFQARHPNMMQFTRWDVCDCYTDVIRETYSSEESLNMKADQAKKLTVKLISRCNWKFEKPREMTERPSIDKIHFNHANLRHYIGDGNDVL